MIIVVLFATIITFLLVITILSADELTIPYSCYPKVIQTKFAEHNLKLDLNGDERTKDSWGFIKNEGAQYKIFTYKSITREELNLVTKIVGETAREELQDGENDSR